MDKKETKRIAKMMEMPKIDAKFVSDFIKSIRDYRNEDGSLPFATPDYMYMDEMIETLEKSKLIVKGVKDEHG